ncbi:uncharacterized protein DMENIID0001_050280 [Sergentomyia squamirostris]
MGGELTKSKIVRESAHKVHCSEEMMRVEISLPSTEQMQNPQIYLDGMKGYPDPRCQPQIAGSLAEFHLSLTDIYECGVTRIVNKITGKKVFYHRIIIEGKGGKEIVSVKCITTGPVYNVTQGHGIVRRDTLPAGFQEPEDLEITTMVIEKAPEPILGVGVRQGDELVSGELNVSPGTPLKMEIYLDKASSPVYGLGVTYMQVTDTRSQEETIIFNGCSVDPYLFENFVTEDGDFLMAKFRAFKFPETTFVQFRGTVNVCLDKCQGIPCSNGQIGYGRRKREIPSQADPNKVYEISMATFIKVNYEKGVDQETIDELEAKLKQLKIANQKLARNSRGSIQEIDNSKLNYRSDGESATVEETTLVKVQQGAASVTTCSLITILLTSLSLTFV